MLSVYFKKVQTNVKDNDGETVLYQYAVKKGNKEIVERLLQKGADVNLRDKFGITALMRAVSSNHKEIIERLLQKGACKCH